MIAFRMVPGLKICCKPICWEIESLDVRYQRCSQVVSKGASSTKGMSYSSFIISDSDNYRNDLQSKNGECKFNYQNKMIRDEGRNRGTTGVLKTSSIITCDGREFTTVQVKYN